MFETFDLTVLNSPEFKEDAVREEIVAPILRKLGYGPSGATRVQRSKNLVHPFVHIGTRRHPVNIIPDYTIIVDERPMLILDAKAPTESVVQSQHVEQAYSYAIHPEVRCHHFALCNGRQLAVYDVGSVAPLLVLPIEEFDIRWPDIVKHLSPLYLTIPALRGFHLDMGLHAIRMGLLFSKIIFLSCRLQMIGRVNDKLYTATTSTSIGDAKYMASFDFPRKFLAPMFACLATPLREQVLGALSRAPFKVYLDGMVNVGLVTRLGAPTRGEHDTFVPFLIKEVVTSRLDRTPLEDPNDVPAHIFRLKTAFEAMRNG